jgi:hypothetical protein
MVVRGQIHVPTALCPEKQFLVSTGQVVWALSGYGHSASAIYYDSEGVN